jgi:threonine/homoserine/homoserine lactone efflux protein
MVNTHRLIALAATAFVFIVIPGPSVLFVITRGVTLGRRAALATVVGNTSGLAVHVAAVVAGLGAVVSRSIVVFTAIKFVGAAYLVFLGVQAIRHRRSLVDALAAGTEPRPIGRVIREGFMVGVSNPKSIVLFTAILPQFVDQTRGQPSAQLLVLGAVCLLIALTCDSVWAWAAGSARAWLVRRPERLATIAATGGVTIVGLGVRLAVTGRKD